jgi:hypothetical protein
MGNTGAAIDTAISAGASRLPWAGQSAGQKPEPVGTSASRRTKQLYCQSLEQWVAVVFLRHGADLQHRVGLRGQARGTTVCKAAIVGGWT